MVERLCAALDGLPLAIELAATQSGSTSLHELLGIIERGADPLARRGGGSRQRSLDAVLEWSLDRLPQPRRSSLLVLSIVPGRFDLDMATAILAEVESCESDAVRSLTRASLVDLDGESYRILDTIRHAAQRLLSQDAELSASSRRGLRAWALKLSADLYRARRRYDDVPSALPLSLEVALEHAMDDGVTGIGKLWSLCRAIYAYREPSRRLLELARRTLSGDVQATTDGILSVSCALDVLDRVGEPLSMSDDRLEAFCAAADDRGGAHETAHLHYEVAWRYAERGEVAAARRHLDRFAAIDVSDDGRETADLVHQLRSMVAFAAGDAEGVLTHAELFLEEVRRTGDETELEIAEANLAEALLDLGRAPEALPHALEALRLSPRPRVARRFILLQLARAQHQLGEAEAARATMHEIEAELRSSGLPEERMQAEREGLQQAWRAQTGVPVGD